jgi:Tol biopolymer transport system component
MALYSTRPDGTGLKALTPVLGADHFWDPALSPDGTQIAYSTWENNVMDGRLDGWSHILNLADGRDQQVRFGALDAEIKGKFSPDGTKMVFEQQRILSNGDWDRRIAISSSSGDDQGSIPIGPAFGHDATYAFGFSPDGAQVFVQIGPTTRIYRASDGTALGSDLDMSFPPSWQRLGT